MGAKTEIAWTDATFNPWWGCQRVSPGCEHCYAETFSKRVGLKVWGPTTDRRFFAQKHWDEPHRWNLAAERAGVRRRVFCASMADVCEDRRDLDRWRLKLRALIECTPWLDWQLLSKRPENFVRLLWPGEWPKNAWAGCTVEDQRRADERIPWLRQVPAAVRFLSVEPMLEAVPRLGLTRWPGVTGDGIHWVIVGGESGPGARPFDIAWALDVVAQCRHAGVACFVKQLGARPIETPCPKCGGGDPDTCGVCAGGNVAHPRFADPKGGDWSEWPETLRVRQFPDQEVA